MNPPSAQPSRAAVRASPVVLKAQEKAVAASLALLHSLVTTQAAPTNFSQRRVATEEEVLGRVFDRFERWQTLRAVLQVLNFGAMLWALVSYVSTF